MLIGIVIGSIGTLIIYSCIIAAKNADENSEEIYRRYKEKHKGDEK